MPFFILIKNVWRAGEEFALFAVVNNLNLICLIRLKSLSNDDDDRDVESKQKKKMRFAKMWAGFKKKKLLWLQNDMKNLKEKKNNKTIKNLKNVEVFVHQHELLKKENVPSNKQTK